MDKFLLGGSVDNLSKAKRVILKCDPALIADVHSIVESRDYVAVVRTLEPDMGIVELIATRDTFEEAVEICKRLERQIGAIILHPARKPWEKA